MVAFNYVFPYEFVDDDVYQFRNCDGILKKNQLGSFFIDSTDAALLRYHNRANFCYAIQDWNFTENDRRINENCKLLTSGITFLLNKRKELLKT